MSCRKFRKMVEEAFGGLSFPGPNRLVDSRSDEAVAVASAFRDCSDWRTLDSDFLNSAPEGLGTALNFFSPEAFRFFLPAYLLADIEGKLPFVEPDFSLCYPYSDFGGNKDDFENRNSIFSPLQCKVIVEYLKLRLCRCDDPMIENALKGFWIPRCSLEK